MKLYTVFFLVLFFKTEFAQWNIIQQIPPQIINHVYHDGNNIFASGDTLYISSDKGISWRSFSFPEYPVVTRVLRAGNFIFAGTFGKGVFRSSDNGFTWETFNNGLDGWSLYITDFQQWDNILYLATDGAGVFYTDLNSASGWSEYNTGLFSNYSYTMIDLCRSNNNLIASAGASGYYYIREHGAPSWIEKTLDPATTRFGTPTSFLSSGDTVFTGTRLGIFRSTDGGQNFDSVGIRALPLRSVTFTRYINRIYAGFTRDADFFIWYSDDFGTTWNSFDHQFIHLVQLTVHENTLWAATGDGLWYYPLQPSSTDPDLPEIKFALHQNYPNPFNPSTVVSFSLLQTGKVNISIYNITGELVSVIADNEMSAGNHKLNFDASGLSSGIYICTLRTEDQISSIKMMVVR